MVCSWLYKTLEDSLDDILEAKDQELIKNFVIKLLDAYAKQSDNQLDDMMVDLIRRRLLNLPLPQDNVFDMMHRLAKILPACEYRTELISGLAYIQDNFNVPVPDDTPVPTKSVAVPLEKVERIEIEEVDEDDDDDDNLSKTDSDTASKIGDDTMLSPPPLSSNSSENEKVSAPPNRKKGSSPTSRNSSILGADIPYPK